MYHLGTEFKHKDQETVQRIVRVTGKTIFTKAIITRNGRVTLSGYQNRRPIAKFEQMLREGILVILKGGKIEVDHDSAEEKLYRRLLEDTQVLRQEYVEKMVAYAKEDFEYHNKIVNYTVTEWCHHYGVEPVMKKYVYREEEVASYPDDWYGHTKHHNGSKQRRLMDKAYAITSKGPVAYERKMEKAAIEHYENSIRKLANRILAKGLNAEKATLKTAKVGVNIETLISDGDLTVYARTIIASGPYVRPHYRYIIT